MTHYINADWVASHLDPHCVIPGAIADGYNPADLADGLINVWMAFRTDPAAVDVSGADVREAVEAYVGICDDDIAEEE